jgi:hypothetical protein
MYCIIEWNKAESIECCVSDPDSIDSNGPKKGKKEKRKKFRV